MNVLLIGLGGIGLQYDLAHPGRVQTHARAVSEHKPQRFCAVDPDPAARQCFEASYSGQAYADCASLPTGVHWHVIIIGSPTRFHLENCQWALEQQPDLILMEKPLAHSAEELRIMDRLVARGKSRIMVNLIRNYDPLSLSVLSQLDFHEPVSGLVHYAKGFLHNGIHFLTFLMKYFGAVESAAVLMPSSERPVVQMRLGAANVVFLPNDANSRLNGLSLRQGSTEISWIDGGRSILRVSEHGSVLEANVGFDRYQARVFKQALRVLDGADDDSYALASQAQKIMIGLLKQEAVE